MANINSQKKRIRQDSKRNTRNKSLKSELKTTLKSLENGEVSVETKNQALKSLDVASVLVELGFLYQMDIQTEQMEV